VLVKSKPTPNLGGNHSFKLWNTSAAYDSRLEAEPLSPTLVIFLFLINSF